jgi:hypothetical protein
MDPDPGLGLQIGGNIITNFKEENRRDLQEIFSYSVGVSAYSLRIRDILLNEGNQIHNFISSSGSGTVINYGSGSGSDFLTSYGFDSGSGSISQKVTVPTVPVPQRCYPSTLLSRSRSSSSISFTTKKNADMDGTGAIGTVPAVFYLGCQTLSEYGSI